MVYSQQRSAVGITTIRSCDLCCDQSACSVMMSLYHITLRVRRRCHGNGMWLMTRLSVLNACPGLPWRVSTHNMNLWVWHPFSSPLLLVKIADCVPVLLFLFSVLDQKRQGSVCVMEGGSSALCSKLSL